MRQTLARYRLLLGYAAPYWRGWLLIVGVTLLSTAFSLLQPWPMKILVDHVLGHAPMEGTLKQVVAIIPGTGTSGGLIAWAALGGLAVFAFNSVVDVILSLAWVRVGQQMVYDLARDLFARLQRRSLIFHSRGDVGDAVMRVTGDSWSVHSVVNTIVFAPGQAALTLAAMLVLMWQMDWQLTLVSLAAVPLMVALSYLFGRSVRTVAHAARESEGRIYSHVQQTLRAIPVVQAFSREEREYRRFRDYADDVIRTQRRSALVGSVHGLVGGLISTLGNGVVLWFGARQVLTGSLTVGELLVFLAYLGSMQGEVGTFTGMYVTLQGASASTDRVLEILETNPEVQDRPGAVLLPPVRGHVRLEGVTFGYDPERPVLHDVSLEAFPGETLALVGQTGAGKSTLVSLLPRFFDPQQGRVLIDGHDLREVQLKSVREQVALVLQEPFLFPFSVAENIAYGRPEATREEVEAAAKAANAHAFIERLPEGYDTVIGERGATLSGGERQRLAIARALLKDAPILILDEPTSALDAETEALLLEALERLMAGRTTFIIAHRLSTIRKADRVVVIHDGRVIESGTHRELLAYGGRFARLQHYTNGSGASEAPGLVGAE